MKTRERDCQLEMSAVRRPFLSIPGPKPYPLMGTLPHYILPQGVLGSEGFSFNRLMDTGKKKYAKFGPIVREEVVPGVKLVSLFKPDDIRDAYRFEGAYPSRRSHLALEVHRLSKPDIYNNAGLLPTNGPEWARIRKAVQPVMSPHQIIDSFDNNSALAREFAERLALKGQARRDLVHDLKAFFLEVTVQFLFGRRLGALEQSAESLALMQAAVDTNANVLSTDNGRLWRYFPSKAYSKISSGQTKIEHFVLSEFLKRNPDSLLIRHCRDHPDLDEKDLVTVAADIMLAGIDTSAFTMDFLLYNLARNPSEQSNLRSVCQERPKNLKYFTLGKHALKESLRLNPISVGVGRILPEDAVIGGHEIPKGAYLVTQNQVSCRLPEYFTEPDEFQPSRWARSDRSSNAIHPYLVLPFGHGQRSCIARRLAEQSLLLLLNHVIRRIVFSWPEEERIKGPIGTISRPINEPDRPILLDIEPV